MADIESDIEELEELIDGLANKLPGNRHLWTAINKLQLAIYDHNKSIENMKEALHDLNRALLL